MVNNRGINENYPIYYSDDGNECWLKENNDGSLSIGSNFGLEDIEIIKRLLFALSIGKQKEHEK